MRPVVFFREVDGLPGLALAALATGLGGVAFFAAFAGLAASFFSGLGTERSGLGEERLLLDAAASADRCTIVKRIWSTAVW